MKIGSVCYMLLFLLLGCGGDGGVSSAINSRTLQTISFGDSLSDVGTYAVAGAPQVGPLVFGGGRYTTNPGMVWTQYVAQHYGDMLTPAMQGGFGTAPVARGGYGYAQGGATVATVITQDYSGALAMPVSHQVSAYLASHHAFNSSQLILIQGGGNDIIGAVRSAAAGRIAATEALERVTSAAMELAATVDRIVAAGGQKIALLNVPDIGMTPFAVRNAVLAPELSRMSKLFNDTLRAQFASQHLPQQFMMIDAYGWYADVMKRYRQSGFNVANDGISCNSSKIITEAISVGLPDPQVFLEENGAAIICSPATLTEPDADQTFMFADEFHPASRLQELFASFVEGQLEAEGI